MPLSIVPLLITLLLAATTAAAAPARNAALAEEYLEMTRLADSYESILREGAAQLEAGAAAVPCEAIKPVIRERNAEINGYVRARLTSKETHAKTVAIVQEVFTDDDLTKMLEFMKSPLGKSMAERTPQVTRKMLDLMAQSEADAQKKSAELETQYRPRFEAMREECAAQIKRDAAHAGVAKPPEAAPKKSPH